MKVSKHFKLNLPNFYKLFDYQLKRIQKKMKIILVGYMGSGKSTVGTQLSATLEYPFLDLDATIEAEEGKKIAQIFSEKGEVYFRKLENKRLKEIIAQEGDIVIATGGGTPCYGDAMHILVENKECVTVYLKTSLETLTRRLFAEKASRPLIAHLTSVEEVNDFIRKHLFERSYYYNQASVKITTDALQVEEIVTEIQTILA